MHEGKPSRVLQGHRARVCCLHAHPFGDFVASGGADASVKIWDGRKKACLQTYRGHSGDVEVVKFSPDGRWVASSARHDGHIRVWDLTAGKLLKTLVAGRSGACHATHLEFSPFEFVLASASSDKIVRVFDLEVWREVGLTPPELSPCRALAFSSTGKSVVAATDTSVRQWDWDGPKVKQRGSFFTGDPGWDKVQEIHCKADLALAVCFQSNLVSVWTATLEPDTAADADADEGTAKDAKGDPSPEKSLRSSISKRGAPQDALAQHKKAVFPSAADVADGDDGQQRGYDDDDFCDDDDDEEEEDEEEDEATVVSAEPKSNANGRASSSEAKRREEAEAARAELVASARIEAKLAAPSDAEDALTELLMSRPSVRILADRLDHLKAARARWATGDVGAAVNAVAGACESGDGDLTRFALAADFLGAVELRTEQLRLEDALVLLPLLEAMLGTAQEASAGPAAARHARVALDAAAAVVELFGTYVTETRKAPPNGVDLAREERKARCNRVHVSFGALKHKLPPLRRAHKADATVQNAAATLDAKLNNYALKAAS